MESPLNCSVPLTMNWKGTLPVQDRIGEAHSDCRSLKNIPSVGMPSNTQVMLSASSKQGPETSTAVPPSMLPKRGLNVNTDDGTQSIAVEQLEVSSGMTV